MIVDRVVRPDKIIYTIQQLVTALNGGLSAGDNFAPDGDTGQVLMSNGEGARPTWQDIPGGGVVTVIGTEDRITVTGPVTTPQIDIASSYVGQGSITTLGTITTGEWTASVIASGHGGTGLTAWTQGDLPYYDSGVALSKLAIGSAGKIVSSTGTAPAWSTPASLGILTTVGLTPGTLPYASAASVLSDSLLSQAAGVVSLNGKLVVGTDPGTLLGVTGNYRMSGPFVLLGTSEAAGSSLFVISDQVATSNAARFQITNFDNVTAGNSPFLDLIRGRGTPASASSGDGSGQVHALDVLGGITFRGYDNTLGGSGTRRVGAQILAQAVDTFTSASWGTSLIVQLVATGATGFTNALSLTAGSAIFSGTGSFASTTDSSSVATGSLVTSGGLGVAKKLFVGTSLSVATTGTGILGDFSPSGALGDQDYLRVNSRAFFGYDGVRANTVIQAVAGKGIDFNVNNATFGSGLAWGISSTGTLTGAFPLVISDTTDASSSITGSLKTAGGLGVAKSLWVGTTGNFATSVIAGTDPTPIFGTLTLGVTGGVGVDQGNTSNRFIISAQHNGSPLQVWSYGTAGAALTLYRLNGAPGSVTAVLSNDTIGSLAFQGWNGSAGTQGAVILAQSGENWSTSANGTRLAFRTAIDGGLLATRWEIGHAAAHFFPFATNTYDLGLSTNTVRTGYFGTSVVVRNDPAGISPAIISTNALRLGSTDAGAAGFDPVFGQFLLFRSGNQGNIVFARRDGTWAIPTAVGNASIIGAMRWSGYDGAADQVTARILVTTTEAVGATFGSKMQFQTVLTGGTTLADRLVIDGTGLATFAGDVAAVGKFGVNGATPQTAYAVGPLVAMSPTAGGFGFISAAEATAFKNTVRALQQMAANCGLGALT